MNRKIICLVLACLFCCFYVKVAAKESQVKSKVVFDTIPMSLEDQAQNTAYIFRGKIVEINDGKIENGLPCKDVKFEIKKNGWIKGEQLWTKKGNSKYFIARMWVQVFNATSYKVGEEIIGAFHDFSEIGLTAPAAIHQGIYRIIPSQNSPGKIQREVAVNKSNSIAGSFYTSKRLEKVNKGLYERLKKSSNGDSVEVQDLIDAFTILSKEAR